MLLWILDHLWYTIFFKDRRRKCAFESPGFLLGFHWVIFWYDDILEHVLRPNAQSLLICVVSKLALRSDFAHFDCLTFAELLVILCHCLVELLLLCLLSPLLGCRLILLNCWYDSFISRWQRITLCFNLLPQVFYLDSGPILSVVSHLYFFPHWDLESTHLLWFVHNLVLYVWQDLYWPISYVRGAFVQFVAKRVEDVLSGRRLLEILLLAIYS